MSTNVQTDVLVTGLGPAGAAAALALARQGIKTIAINKYGSTSPGPRAHITNQRTMEFLRDFGLEEAGKELSTPWSYMGNHVFATSLTGEEYGRIPAWASSAESQGAHLAASPSAYCDLPQLYLEPLLVNHAALSGAQIRMDTEYVSHTQDSDGVTTTLRDLLSGHQYQVRSRYLLGADGARSQIATDIGLEFDGAMALGETGSINIEFEADLSAWCDHRRSDMYWMLQVGPNLNGLAKGPGFSVLRMVRPWNSWVCVVGYELAKGAPTLSNEEAIAFVHRTIGSTEVGVKVTAMSNWTFNRQYALGNTKGRVFCMGDAVHRHTPFGGLGANTSIQDAYNLAWKLAMVLKGQAGPKLLDSYDAERSPVARQITEHAFNGAQSLGALAQALGVPPGATQEDLERCLASLKAPTQEGKAHRQAMRAAMDGTLDGFGAAHGIELNQRYRSQAIAAETPEVQFSDDPVRIYQPSTEPGAHLPHAWVTQNQKKVSTFDLCGKGRFTLLTGLSGLAWKASAEQAAHKLGIDLQVHVMGPGQEVIDSQGRFSALAEIDESGALLVRPDLMIAWRAPDASDKHLSRLEAVLRKILDREPA